MPVQESHVLRTIRWARSFLVDGTSYGDAIERVFGTPCGTPGSDLSIHVALDDTVCRDSFQNPTCLPVHLFRRHNHPFTFDTQVEIFE